MRVAVLHMYSVENAGDGLLVEETIKLIREGLGTDAELVIAAARPHGASNSLGNILCSMPSIRGYDREYLSFLRNLGRFDLVVGVGGGYLRAGTLLEGAKCALVHGPQLAASAMSGCPAVYLPQSIGPARFGTRALFRSALARLQSVHLRDDRSVSELKLPNAVRSPDLALMMPLPSALADDEVDSVPVLSVREVRGKLPHAARELAERLGVFDSFVQSTVGGNDDSNVNIRLNPRRMIPRVELMQGHAPPRVVVSMRLHGALMAIRAGHFVIHLSYERKGFGAYSDLGLDNYVHNVFSFDVEQVAEQIRALVHSEEVRARYSSQLAARSDRRASQRARLVESLREYGSCRR